MKKFLAAAMSLAVLGTAGVASATMIAIGDPFDGGSWAQRIQQTYSGGFDKLEWFVVGGTGNFNFEPTGFQNFGYTDASWSGAVVNDHYAVATGNLDDYLQFDAHFSGLVGDGTMETYWLTWKQGVLVEFGSYNKGTGEFGSDWKDMGVNNYSQFGFDRTAAVPEPGTLLLLGSGLLGLAAVRKNRKQLAA